MTAMGHRLLRCRYLRSHVVHVQHGSDFEAQHCNRGPEIEKRSTCRHCQTS
jgi:hypothetical protein